ncbi:uncharacterized protein LOC106174941 isoform X1 [Lingula anatina]|uniref:Uncharacterized protein LOC106174941 isoform X1 n=1 Tax=Lingula anatina TaxID=7574 RepID=A0A1S3JP83_LINAN|nr:uncharacterized protein LOC106174941 isoform X1 [Lingula anatina]|eukprot:XP_013412175.1 uncharacterized protein LOC106174941 isoform X1 [Lingula anatina]
MGSGASKKKVINNRVEYDVQKHVADVGSKNVGDVTEKSRHDNSAPLIEDLEEVIEPAIRKEVAVPLGSAPRTSGSHDSSTQHQESRSDEKTESKDKEDDEGTEEVDISHEPNNATQPNEYLDREPNDKNLDDDFRSTCIANENETSPSDEDASPDALGVSKAKPETECIIAVEPTKEIKKPFKHVWQIFGMYASVVKENQAKNLPGVALKVGKELKAVEKELHERYKTRKELQYFAKIGLTTKCMKCCLVKAKIKDFLSVWQDSTGALALSLLLRRLKRQLEITKSYNETESMDLHNPLGNTKAEMVANLAGSGAEALDRADEFGLTNVGEHILEDALDLGDGLPYIKTVLSIIRSVYRIFKANATLLNDAMDLLRTIRNVEVILGGTIIAKDDKSAFLLEQLMDVLDQAEFYVIQCIMPDQNAVAKVLKATSRADTLQQLKEDIVKQLNQAMFAETMKQSEVLQTLDQKANKMLELKVTLEQIETNQRNQTNDIQEMKESLQQIMEGLTPSKYKPANGNYLEIGPYRVQVQGGRHFKTAEGEYVELGSGYNYRLLLRNGTKRKCQAEVHIDGHKIGVFALLGEEEYVIERPVGIQRRFMFYRTTTGAAIANSGIEAKRRENGVLECVFTPELLYTFKGRLRNYKGELSEVHTVDLSPDQQMEDFVRSVIASSTGFEQSADAYLLLCGERYWHIDNFDWGVKQLYNYWKGTASEYLLFIEIAKEVHIINPIDDENVEKESFTVGYTADVKEEVKARFNIPSLEDVSISDTKKADECEIYTVRILKVKVKVVNPPDTLTLYFFKSQDVKEMVEKELAINESSDQSIEIHHTKDSVHEHFVSDVTVVVNKDITLHVTAFDGRQDDVVVKTYSTIEQLMYQLKEQNLVESDSDGFKHSHKECQVNEVEYRWTESKSMYLALEGFSNGSTVVVKPTIFSYTIRYRGKGSEEELSIKIEAYKRVADLVERTEKECDEKGLNLPKGFFLVRGDSEILDTSMALRELGGSQDLTILAPQSDVSIVEYDTLEEIGTVSDVTVETTIQELLDKIRQLLGKREGNLDDASVEERHICIEFENNNSFTTFYNTMINDKDDLKDTLPVSLLIAAPPTVKMIESRPMEVTLDIFSENLSGSWQKKVITESCSTVALVLRRLIDGAVKTSETGNVVQDENEYKLRFLKPEWLFIRGTKTKIPFERRCLAQLGIGHESTIKLTDTSLYEIEEMEKLQAKLKMEMDDLDMERLKRKEKLSRRLKEYHRELDDRPLIKMKAAERKLRYILDADEALHSISDYRVCSGATTLQGGSRQEFEPVEPFPLDHSNSVVLSLRMVARVGSECPLPLDDECIPLASVRLLDKPIHTMVRPIDGTTVKCEAPPPLPD